MTQQNDEIEMYRIGRCYRQSVFKAQEIFQLPTNEIIFTRVNFEKTIQSNGNGAVYDYALTLPAIKYN